MICTFLCFLVKKNTIIEFMFEEGEDLVAMCGCRRGDVGWC